MKTYLKAPWPYFGGKSKAADLIWSRLGQLNHYIEPFCGSAAVLLASPTISKLEVIGDLNYYVANFWRSVKHQPDTVIEHIVHPVIHVDLYARHCWLTDPSRIKNLRERLLDAEWPGDAKIAGWWAWGMCAWIGSGWCSKTPIMKSVGLDSPGQIPFLSRSGQGIQAAHGSVDVVENARQWILTLSKRLERVKVINALWERCLNMSYFKGKKTGIFFDPIYKSYEAVYGVEKSVAGDVEEWCRERTDSDLRMVLCGHEGDYILPGWKTEVLSRGARTFNNKSKHEDVFWFSPGCLNVRHS